MNNLIQYALRHRLAVVMLALVALVHGGWTVLGLPIDIFPNLTRPRVTIMTEVEGFSPEEVETQVTLPLETTLLGATGVETVRSASGIGLSVVHVEFGWRTSITVARQVVQERLSLALAQLPAGVLPQMAPISSIMGQVMMIGLASEGEKTTPRQLRTLADAVLRPRLLSVSGVSQIITMGGERKQHHVLVHPPSLAALNVSLAEVEQALRQGSENTTGGYASQGPIEHLVRVVGRAESPEDLGMIVVKDQPGRAVLLRDVARIVEAGQPKRGDCSVNGAPCVLLILQKQPDADTIRLTEQAEQALRDLRPSLPKDVVIDPTVFRQRTFIDHGVHNVIDALRDGSILVAIVLFLFLMNVRTTLITLTAIPLSMVMAGLIFHWFGLSINVMTLGGLAVALGELVDDAIVDIENIHRRLRLNAQLSAPLPKLRVIYEASVEIRSAIVFGTMLVILVYLPLFSLSGMEGRMFAPLGVAYIVSILASLLVSLTVTPVLASLLLSAPTASTAHHDSLFLRFLKRLATPIIRFSMHPAGLTLGLITVGLAIGGSFLLAQRLGADFLPPFDEGASQVNVLLPPGSSLEASNHISAIIDARLLTHRQTPENPRGPIRNFVRRSGRAELDEHAEGVHVTEYIVNFNADSGLTRQQTIQLIEDELADVPGIVSAVEQPLAHLLSHMLSGVNAPIAIKIFGDDLDILRRKAEEAKAHIASVPGLSAPIVEQQQLVPQLRIKLDRQKLALHGLTPHIVTEFLRVALHGEVVASIPEGQRMIEVVVRFDEPYRTDARHWSRLTLGLPTGEQLPLGALALVDESAGPTIIQREHGRRRIALAAKPVGRDLAGVVADIRQRLEQKLELPPGYTWDLGGQFQAQQQASRQIYLLSIVAVVGVFVVLFSLFPSTRIVLQIMLALPIAMVGGVLALWLTQQTLTVASLVGFISLAGIAARNGILLVAHYFHLMREENEGFTAQMVLRGSLERLAPVLMTALTAGLGLLPLVLGGTQPGKEILYPVSTVILGGLITATVCEYLIHPGLFYLLSGNATQKLIDGEPLPASTH